MKSNLIYNKNSIGFLDEDSDTGKELHGLIFVCDLHSENSINQVFYFWEYIDYLFY